MKKTIALILAVMMFALPALAAAEKPLVTVMRALYNRDRAVTANMQIEAGDFNALMATADPEADLSSIANGISALVNALSADAVMNNDLSEINFNLNMSGQPALSGKVSIGEEGVAVQSDWINEKPLYVTWESMTPKDAETPVDMSIIADYPNQISNYLDMLDKTPDDMAEFALNSMPKTNAVVQNLLENAFARPAAEYFDDSDTAAIRKEIYLTADDIKAFQEAVKADLAENPAFSSLINQVSEDADAQSEPAEEIIPSDRVIPVIVWLDNDNQIVRVDADLNPAGAEPAEEAEPVKAATSTDLGAAKNTATQTSLGDTTRAAGTDVVIPDSSKQAEIAPGHVVYTLKHEGEAVIRGILVNKVPSEQMGEGSTVTLSVRQESQGAEQLFELMALINDANGEAHPLVKATMNAADRSEGSQAEISADISAAVYPTNQKLVVRDGGYVYERTYADEPTNFQVTLLTTGQVNGQDAQMNSECSFFMPAAGQDALLKVTSVIASADRVAPSIDITDAIRPAELSEEELKEFNNQIGTNAQINVMKLLQLLPEESLSLLTLFMQ